ILITKVPQPGFLEDSPSAVHVSANTEQVNVKSILHSRADSSLLSQHLDSINPADHPGQILASTSVLQNHAPTNSRHDRSLHNRSNVHPPEYSQQYRPQFLESLPQFDPFQIDEHWKSSLHFHQKLSLRQKHVHHQSQSTLHAKW